MNDCNSYKATNILATLLEGQFDKELAHQWALASADTDEHSTMEHLLEFVRTRKNTALPPENKETLTTFSSDKEI